MRNLFLTDLWEENLDSIYGHLADKTYQKRATSNLQFTETQEGYLFSVDLPGVKHKDLKVQIENNHLLLDAVRFAPQLHEGKDPKRNEISRIFKTPDDVDAQKIKAHLEDGVLYVALYKKESLKPKEVEISTGKITSEWEKLISPISEEKTEGA